MWGYIVKKFDLNIDRMLENWDAFHAIREIIANALDEQILTSTRDIAITRDFAGQWRIRDFGRGLRHEHFTMNENQEKLNHSGLIGKFGVGLKDALATFDRLGIETRIRSKFCDVSFDRSEKHDFSDVITLGGFKTEVQHLANPVRCEDDDEIQTAAA